MSEKVIVDGITCKDCANRYTFDCPTWRTSEDDSCFAAKENQVEVDK